MRNNARAQSKIAMWEFVPNTHAESSACLIFEKKNSTQRIERKKKVARKKKEIQKELAEQSAFSFFVEFTRL